MKQTRLAIDLERRGALRVAIGNHQKQELVLLIAQAIVAVHRGRQDEERVDERREADDVDGE